MMVLGGQYLPLGAVAAGGRRGRTSLWGLGARLGDVRAGTRGESAGAHPSRNTESESCLWEVVGVGLGARAWVHLGAGPGRARAW